MSDPLLEQKYEDELSSLKAQVEALTKERDALLKDRERLDWLDRCDTNFLELCAENDDKWGYWSNDWQSCFTSDDLRQVIDAARGE